MGALGDVIRTTPLLTRLKKDYPKSKITWLTKFPEIIPDIVDRILNLTLESTLSLLAEKFDLLINLDKDPEAIALASTIKAKTKKGFSAKNGLCFPIDSSATEKWLTGLFDDLNKENRKSYLEEIFGIYGGKFSKEKYILRDNYKKYSWQIDAPKPIVGLNTGCGSRWLTRLWPDKHWVDLAINLRKKGYGVLILGGPDEHQKNPQIAKQSSSSYLGHFPIEKFISLVGECDLVVTQVTAALHISIGLEKKVILLNNIFNRHEFELYGLGTILEPDLDCLGCFKNNCDINCMEMIEPNTVENAIDKLLNG
jgi:heptosyltransferase-2